MKKIHSDIYISIAMLIFSISLLSMALGMPEGPSKFPKIILLFLVIFSVYIFITGLKKTLKQSDTGKKFLNFKYPMTTFLIILAYVILIDFLGFFSSTTLFVAAFMFYYNVRKYHVVFMCLLGVNLFVYALFVWQLNIQLPSGILF
jgi:uncharacterized membrane protein YidH (DUF202 family)